MEKLENGGAVVLWSGWAIELPRACFGRNDDGTWSAWADDWVVDITIIDIGGDANGRPVAPTALLGELHSSKQIKGNGWIGALDQIEEMNDGRKVIRVATKLAAINSIMHCWVSVFSKDKVAFANSLVQAVRHRHSHRN